MSGKGICSMTRMACLVVVVGVLAAGCAQSKKSGANQPVNATLMEEYPPDANTVNVTLNNGEVAMPEIIGSGWTNFVVQNGDNMAHTFGIRGNGVYRLLPDPVAPGQMQFMRIELKPGTYEVTCPDCGTDTGAVARQLIVAEW